MNGQTPLDEALANKRTNTAEILRKQGGKTGEELKAEELIKEKAKKNPKLN